MALPDRLHGEKPGTMLPRPVYYVLRNAATGAAIGVALVVLLIVTNAAGLGHLIRDSADPVTPVLLAILGFATLFGGLYAAGAIMMMSRREEDED